MFRRLYGAILITITPNIVLPFHVCHNCSPGFVLWLWLYNKPLSEGSPKAGVPVAVPQPKKRGLPLIRGVFVFEARHYTYVGEGADVSEGATFGDVPK